MESRAIKKYIGSSPRKMRLVTDLIRYKSVKEGLAILKYSKKHSAKEVEKTLKSAYNNLINALDTGKLDTEDVFIKEIFVNGGPTMKRLLPAPQGRAYRVRKRSAHLTIIVENIETAEGTKPKKVKPVKEEAKPKAVKKKAENKEAEVTADESKKRQKKDAAPKKKVTEKKTSKPRTKKADTDESEVKDEQDKGNAKTRKPNKPNNKE
jgi:large subunit ribosomal protein L22